jgi:catechol 2,3-dioxygenase-like lactoylglutathione lyase family enzyme
MELSQAILKVEQFGACVRFYRDLLGCDLVGGDEAGPVAYFTSGGQRFGLLDARAVPAEAAGTIGGAPGAPRVTFAFRAENVDEAHRRLCEAGVRFTIEPHDFEAWGVRSSLCLDPDGNPVEIFASLPGGGS